MTHSFKDWLFATRPWSFTASAVPILVGTAYGAMHGFHFGLFILTLLGGILIQAGTNLINTHEDFANGIDTLESAPTVRELVTEKMQPAEIKKAGLLAFATAALLGLVLIYFTGWTILFFGVLGILGGYGYTAGRLPYKYIALGPLMVFVLMGPLMTMPSYFVQTGEISWSSALVSLPISFLVAAILHANELRDIEFDKQAKISTLSIFTGFRISCYIYILLCACAYISLILLAVFKVTPYTSLLPLILLPEQFKILKTVLSFDEERIKPLEGITGQWHFKFGFLYAVGIFIKAFI